MCWLPLAVLRSTVCASNRPWAWRAQSAAIPNLRCPGWRTASRSKLMIRWSNESCECRKHRKYQIHILPNTHNMTTFSVNTHSPTKYSQLHPKLLCSGEKYPVCTSLPSRRWTVNNLLVRISNGNTVSVLLGNNVARSRAIISAVQVYVFRAPLGGWGTNQPSITHWPTCQTIWVSSLSSVGWGSFSSISFPQLLLPLKI